MNTNDSKTIKTELVFILDKSGSMSGLESDTIGGYNAMLKKQQQATGEARVTTVLFDDGYEVLHDRIDIQGVAPITENEYYVGGCTALLDAIGKTIHKIANAQRHTQPEHRSDQVIFVITTDGLENASREYSYEKIKKLIELEKTQYQWEFIFLGANIDAIETAARFGIDADRAANYHADGAGTQLNYRVVSEMVSEFRDSNPIPANWKAEIDEDFERRGKTEKSHSAEKSV
ncbi:MAG: vWA domain-containing protein [Acetobacterium sp.]|uniref:vWA domain-containing protein n=1 Tax=Acetobacterium sp. TaxID=1872094 RepID=UPI0032425B98